VTRTGVRCADVPRRRCARCLHCGASRSSSRSRGWRSHATDDAGLHREHPQSGRWENLADRDAAGGVRHRASARSQGAHGWCSSAQCCRGDWSTGRDLVPLGRYRLDRSLQRTRLPGRRGCWLATVRRCGWPAGTSRCSAARCVKLASWPPQASTRSSTMSSDWPRIMRMRGSSPKGWRKLLGSASIR
jgi:hypothetical protein